MSKYKLAVILIIAIGYVVAPAPNATEPELDEALQKKYEKIWKYKRAFQSCENGQNYGCRCTTVQATLMTCDFKCISLDRRCDGHEDCPLGDDETDCPEVEMCEKGSICCTNGSCAMLCDGNPECPGGADEESCPPPIRSQCQGGRMECPNGNCAVICDGDIDCEDEAGCDLDEKDCRFECPAGDIVCGENGATCGEPCNGLSQCSGGTDEENCYLECNEDEVSCELEGSSERECVELCESLSGACETEYDNDDIYCGTCFVCGQSSDPSCEKVVGPCGI